MKTCLLSLLTLSVYEEPAPPKSLPTVLRIRGGGEGAGSMRLRQGCIRMTPLGIGLEPTFPRGGGGGGRSASLAKSLRGRFLEIGYSSWVYDRRFLKLPTEKEGPGRQGG